MSVDVLIGYKDGEGEYHGFQGVLEVTEYRLLKRLAEKCARSDILSIDELKDLSDVKDLLARAQIKLYEFGKELSEARKQKLENLTKVLGETLESFDVYRKDAPQLDFLLSLCIIDASESDYASGKFWAVSEDEEEYDEEITVEKPTKGKKANRYEWINYLVSVKAIPVWDERFHPFPVYFKRLTNTEEGGAHLEGFGKKTRKKVAEILGIETKEDCESVRGEIKERFPLEISSLDESIAVGDIKHVAVSEDFVNAIHELVDDYFDGRRELIDSSVSEDDEGAMETIIEWWRDNMDFFEREPDFVLTTLLFRALRNNVLKCKRTGKLVLSSKEWSKRMEVL